MIAGKLRALMANERVVTHDADRSLAVLAAEGVRLDQAPLDTAELASILVPALAATDLDTLREALGVAPGDKVSQRIVADALADAIEALLARNAEFLEMLRYWYDHSDCTAGHLNFGVEMIERTQQLLEGKS